MAQLGDVLNKDQVIDKISGPVAASTTLSIGLVYEDGANGWKVAPTDGSIAGSKMYFNPVSIDNSSGSKGDKICTVYGEGALVIGQSDGIIPVDGRAKASTSSSHGGQFITHAVPTIADEGDTSMTDLGGELAAADQSILTYLDDTVAIYRGHYQQRTESATSRTASADEDTDCVFQIVRC